MTVVDHVARDRVVRACDGDRGVAVRVLHRVAGDRHVVVLRPGRPGVRVRRPDPGVDGADDVAADDREVVGVAVRALRHDAAVGGSDERDPSETVAPALSDSVTVVALMNPVIRERRFVGPAAALMM
jgi:hypothetical protein